MSTRPFIGARAEDGVRKVINGWLRKSGWVESVIPYTGYGTTEQNTLETSNVDVVEEMVNMITTQRTYEMNSKVIKTADEMLQFITQTL